MRRRDLIDNDDLPSNRLDRWMNAPLTRGELLAILALVLAIVGSSVFCLVSIASR